VDTCGEKMDMFPKKRADGVSEIGSERKSSKELYQRIYIF